MKVVVSLLFALAAFAAAFAQAGVDVIATTKSHTFTAADLSPEVQKLWTGRADQIRTARSRLFERMVNDKLLELEAKASGKTAEVLVTERLKAVPDPTEEQIKAVYETNKAALANSALADVRGDIVSFLRREPEEKAMTAYLAGLKTKFHATMLKDPNAPGVRPSDILATIGSEKITSAELEDSIRLNLNDLEHQIYEDARADLEVAILEKLVDDEANARGIEVSEMIATEITNKMKTFEDGEREALERVLINKLFAKYEVKFKLAEPPNIVQTISTDGAATRGPATAPVTIVMFSDFQCPACSRTDPVLKKVIEGYGDKIRLVVRNYPLEHMHKNSFEAALAGEAALRQGKFFELTEIMYRNQNALDRASLLRYAADAGLNVKQFEIDLSLESSAAKIRKDIADGNRYGVTSTPTIFVNGLKLYRLSADAFARAIDKALAK